MKYKNLLILTLCLLLSGCASTSPTEPPEAADSEAPASLEPDQLVRNRERIPGEYDFTHDGQNEVVELIRVEQNGELLWFELEISDADGRLLWGQEAATAHTGWKNFFAYHLDGKDYILDYGPNMYQGYAGYGYHLFSLTKDGREVFYQKNEVDFDVNFDSPTFTGEYDPVAIGAFMDEVHSYLEGDCTLLLSTDGSGALTGTSGADYRGDDFTGGELYAYDGTWEERFVWYREQME